MKNITSTQLALIEQLRAIDPKLRIRWNEARGAAASIRGRLGHISVLDNRRASSLQKFLHTYGVLFGLPDPGTSLKLLRERTDDLGWKHLEFQQIEKVQLTWWQTQTIEVYDARLAVHIQADGTLIEVQSSCWADIHLEARKKVSVSGLRNILTRAIADHPDFKELNRHMIRRKQLSFPMMISPQIVIYPWRGGFRLAWTTHAYSLLKNTRLFQRSDRASQIELGQVFVDATTREIFQFAPTRRDVETPDVGSGLGVTPLGGPFTSRELKIVRVDGSGTYKLRDTTHERDIITFDCAGDPFWSDWEIKYGIHNGTLPVSEDIGGGKNWNRLPADTSETEWTLGQQPEVDAHFFGREAYEWYNALAGATGRAGWDDNQYANPPVPPQPVRVITHLHLGNQMNAYADFETVNNLFYYWLVFGEGNPTATCSTPGDRSESYQAGSKSIFGHEYQHAITDFSFTTSLGRPGLPFMGGYLGAVHEGLSDALGCMFAGTWALGSEIGPNGLAVRNLAYPRDPNTRHNLPYNNGFICGTSGSAKDHFDDRETDVTSHYDVGTILAHCAYLMGTGGVHQRLVRTPALIPVQGLEKETINGIEVMKAARIWYRALTWYLSTHNGANEYPEDDENVFRILRDGCESAAMDLYGEGSVEHRTTVLAFHAVGLQPIEEAYGADPTFFQWGWNWRYSRPFLGGSLSTCPNWSSPDLFINNGGASEWNSLINIYTPFGHTEFENQLYCRVRNVGDQTAENVQVQFEYAKAGTASTIWLPVTDKDGVVQVLDLGSLGAGQSNFGDSDQNNPPAEAGVKWYIPPLELGETVDHFCIKATVTSNNDVDSYNNMVQSNIEYVPLAIDSPFNMEFMAGNPTRKPIPIGFDIQTSLPAGWKVEITEAYENIRLEPGEERPIPIAVHMPGGTDQRFEPPLDGTIRGQLYGSVCGPFEGSVSESRWDGKRLRGRFTATIAELGMLNGMLDVKVDTATGKIRGHATGIWVCGLDRKNNQRVCAGVQGWLRPHRRIEISQIVNGQAIGGMTIQVQVPMPEGSAGIFPMPPTETKVTG